MLKQVTSAAADRPLKGLFARCTTQMLDRRSVQEDVPSSYLLVLKAVFDK